MCRKVNNKQMSHCYNTYETNITIDVYVSHKQQYSVVNIQI